MYQVLTQITVSRHSLRHRPIGPIFTSSLIQSMVATEESDLGSSAWSPEKEHLLDKVVQVLVVAGTHRLSVPILKYLLHGEYMSQILSPGLMPYAR